MDPLSAGTVQSAIQMRIGKASTLVEEVVARVTSDITRGLLPPGSRLPTEKDMMASMGVSRTVIREAFAELRARGLVTTRQGYGAYVAEEALIRPLQITIRESDALRDSLHLVDLRIAIEVEAAALAALNAAAEDLKEIEAAEKRVVAEIRGETFAVTEDFAFHRQVAVATRNPYFPRILDFLGQFMIPRTRVHFDEEARAGYETFIIDQHRQICRAIARGNPVEARSAMREHLEGARRRYAALSETVGKKSGP